MVISPFRPQNFNFAPIEQVPPIQEETKKSDPKHRLYLYRWLGHHPEEERKVTIKIEEKVEKETPKEAKDPLETMVQNLLEPKVSETKEYER